MAACSAWAALNPSLAGFPVAGLSCAARAQLPAGRSIPGHVQGADGGDPHLGTAEAELPPRLHSDLRHPGQHVPPVQAPNEALAVL